ncbi:MAG: hypothetical protein Q9209_003661 [Squamulea sp. 1 TL-2023]
MSSSPGLPPPGSSTYTSNTMSVGDGTWDTTRNTFLLPNLVGLNFATMRYNGMGNRFRELDGYHNLILAHGVMAALTFLLIVPLAVMFMRYKRHRPNAIRFHVWLQVLTFLLATAIIILGFIAVGPERSLTNPHHGIGVAIYVMIVFQFLGGAWIRRKDRKKKASFGWMRKLLHHWLGRTIALLGIAQVALGLTLYGSPKALFVLYALAVFLLVITYFLLEYRDDKNGGIEYDDRYSYSYGSGSVADGGRRHSGGVSNLVKAGAAGIGLGALASRFRNRSRSRHRGEPEVVGSRRHSSDDIVDEKYSDYSRDHDRGGGWKDRLFKIGAVAGGAGLAKKYFDRRRDRDRDSDVGNYGPPLGGATAINADPLERLEEGRPSPSNRHPLDHPLNHHRSTSSMSYSSYTSASQEGRSHGLRNAVAGLGALGLARNIFKGRRERKEKKRLDVMREQERRDRTDNRRLTGDGFPRRGGRRGSITTSTFTDSTEGRPHHDPGLPPPLPPAGTFPVGAGAAGAAIAGHGHGHDRTRPGPPPQTNVPLPTNIPTPANMPAPANMPPPANIPPPPRGPVVAPASMPPIPADPQGGLFHQESSASSADGRHHRQRRSGRNSGAGLAAGEASSHRDRHHSANGGEGSVASPPVSVKVKMHPDGRHVTLRRLPEEEAAAERAARRRSKDRHGRRGGDSVSSLSGAGSGGERWRRTEALERQQAEQMRAESDRLAAARAQAQNTLLPAPVPPPPPMPSSSAGPLPLTGSVSSPGNYDTEASADYANNRRRRRAERAQAKQARGGGNSVEFT